jgi:hypothetical protein
VLFANLFRMVQLIALEDPDERRFYESLAARDHWSVRTLGADGGSLTMTWQVACHTMMTSVASRTGWSAEYIALSCH